MDDELEKALQNDQEAHDEDDWHTIKVKMTVDTLHPRSVEYRSPSPHVIGLIIPRFTFEKMGMPERIQVKIKEIK